MAVPLIQSSWRTKLFLAFCVTSLHAAFASPQLRDLVNTIPTLNVGNTIPESLSAEPKTYKRALDVESGLNLTWTVDRDNGSISFTIETKSRGYVTLVLTNKGQLQGADVIVVGVQEEDGTPYVIDMHGVDNETIAQDQSQDWISESNASSQVQGESGFKITIQRALDSCDDHDMTIGSEKMTIAYATGDDSNVPSQFESEGTIELFFIDPFFPPENSNLNLENVQQWRVAEKHEMPTRPTSYWCRIHKMNPSLEARHHIVGFIPYFPNNETRHHVHHQILYRCVPPVGSSAEDLFEPFLDFAGEECYVNDRPVLPSFYCREMLQTYLIGGQPSYIPESTGISVGEAKNEYFMFEVHYDNPDRTPGIIVESGLDILYTPDLRPNDGGMIFTGYGVMGTFIIPPETSNFTIAGHCSSECSSHMVPLDGMDIIGASLHGHMTAKRIRFKHFRAGKELPWIMHDNDYDFMFQQMRFLDSPRRVMPGDQLTIECLFDTTLANGTAVVSGFSTSKEMCMAFVTVSKRLPYFYCSSEYDVGHTMDRFGIKNITWSKEIQERIINEADDPSIVGLTLSQVVEGQTWSEEETRQLESEQLFRDHGASCPNTRILGGIYFYARTAENATSSLLTFPILSLATPTTTAIRTPSTAFTYTRYPQTASTYTPPPSSCRINSPDTSGTSPSGLSTTIAPQELSMVTGGVSNTDSIRNNQNILDTLQSAPIIQFNSPI